MGNTTLIIWNKLLAGLDQHKKLLINAQLIHEQLQKNDIIFHQGDKAAHIFIVRSGRVRLYQLSSEGKEYSSGIWADGYALGLISALTSDQYFLNALAVDEVEIMKLSVPKFLALMQEIPAFSLNISKALALIAKNSIKRTAFLALEPVQNRLKEVLLGLAHFNSANERYEVIGITQEELATIVGASRAWVNRTLADFENKGLLLRDKRTLVLTKKYFE